MVSLLMIMTRHDNDMCILCRNFLRTEIFDFLFKCKFSWFFYIMHLDVSIIMLTIILPHVSITM